MKVWIITPLVYVVSVVSVVSLEHGKIYEVPESWGKLMVSQQVGAEYIKVWGKA